MTAPAEAMSQITLPEQARARRPRSPSWSRKPVNYDLLKELSDAVRFCATAGGVPRPGLIALRPDQLIGPASECGTAVPPQRSTRTSRFEDKDLPVRGPYRLYCVGCPAACQMIRWNRPIGNRHHVDARCVMEDNMSIPCGPDGADT